MSPGGAHVRLRRAEIFYTNLSSIHTFIPIPTYSRTCSYTYTHMNTYSHLHRLSCICSHAYTHTLIPNPSHTERYTHTHTFTPKLHQLTSSLLYIHSHIFTTILSSICPHTFIHLHVAPNTHTYVLTPTHSHISQTHRLWYTSVWVDCPQNNAATGICVAQVYSIHS